MLLPYLSFIKKNCIDTIYNQNHVWIEFKKKRKDYCHILQFDYPLLKILTYHPSVLK